MVLPTLPSYLDMKRINIGTHDIIRQKNYADIDRK